MKIIYVLIVALIILTGCSTQKVQLNPPDKGMTTTIEEPGAANQPAQTYEVFVRDKSFEPAELKVRPGDVVIFRNADNEDHRIVFDGEEYSGEILTQKDTYEFDVPSTTGSYHYMDKVTGGDGTIIVQ